MLNMFISIILNFSYRTVLIKTVGIDYLGLTSFYTNILVILSLAELGIGHAITYSLYKPLAEKNYDKVLSILNYFRDVYIRVGFFILLIGVLISPFISFFIDGYEHLENIYVIFFLFVVNTSITYFYSYKRILINADQKAYKIVPITLLFLLIDLSIRMLLLIELNNLVLALCWQLVSKVLENYFVNRYIDKNYNILNNKHKRLAENDKQNIKSNVKALIYHKLGDAFVNGTDNIIISKFLGLTIVGMYSNYLLVVSVISSFLMLVFNSMTASVGNLIVQSNTDKVKEVFHISNMIAFWVFGLCSICLYFTLPLFIDLWLGENFLLPPSVNLLICINLFFFGMRVPLGVFKTSSGIFNQDKYAPIIQGVLNIILSVVLVDFYGVAGIIFATIVSGLIVPGVIRPYLVYKIVFKDNVVKYFIDFAKKITILIFASCIVFFAMSKITLSMDSELIMLIFKSVILFSIVNVVFVFCFFRTTEFKQFSAMLRRKLL